MELPTLKFTGSYLGPATEFWHRIKNPFTSAGNRTIALESRIYSDNNYDCYNWLIVRLWSLQVAAKEFLLLNIQDDHLRTHRTNYLMQKTQC